MYSREIVVVNESGLHARPASDFVGLAGTFQSRVELQRVGEEDKYNAKSIIMLMSLGLAQGERAILSAEGEDEKEAVEILKSGEIKIDSDSFFWTPKPTAMPWARST